MKYLVVLGDGMADTPVASLGGKTPLEAAHKPAMDALSQHGICGRVMTVPEGMVPESDTANLGVLGYDPRVYSKGRSPLEAASIGLTMRENDVAFRCNIVTLSDEEAYDDKIMLDHSADEITTEEADALVHALDEAFGTPERRFHTGVSYRHCLLWENPPEIPAFSRPHDILGQVVREYLPPQGEYRRLHEKSYEVLSSHPINENRRKRGLKPANSLWLWSPGKKPELPSFSEKFGLSGTIISAVDLLRGIALCAGMQAPRVPGATGTFHTDYRAKANAAIEAFENGSDFVYVHVEAPDECGHRAETENKVSAIEKIDAEILAVVKEYLDKSGEAYRILLLPDHPTPIAKRTHTREAVPFVIFDSTANCETGIPSYTEKAFQTSSLYLDNGTDLMPLFLGRQPKTN